MEPRLTETSRLAIRSFLPEDVPTIHRILDQTFGDGTLADNPEALEERRRWVQWSMLNHEWFPAIHQPPYGDRAIVLKATNELIGSVGYVPCLSPFGQIPALAHGEPSTDFTNEFGLFWVIDPAHQGRGYATEAGQALIDYAFDKLRLKRIVATTEYDNEASQKVMRKLGMRIERNPLPEPAWFQVVGVLEKEKER